MAIICNILGKCYFSLLKFDLSAENFEKEISIKEKKQSRQSIFNFLENNKLNNPKIPPHLSLNTEYLVGTVNNQVDQAWVGLKINELLIFI